MTPPAPEEPAANAASGDATVGMQIGSVTGNVTYFEVTDTQQPMQKYKVAVRFLNARVASEAGKLIKEVIGTGFRGGYDPEDKTEITANHVAFNWMLAVLSNSERVTESLLAAVAEARGFADPAIDDAWFSGCRAIDKLVECVRRQDEEEQSGRTETGFLEFMRDYEALSPGCREGIQRHLELLLTGGQAVEVEALMASDAMARRTREHEDRLSRAKKFFEPTPEPPRQQRPDPPVFRTGQLILAGLGATLILAGLVCWFVLLQERGVLIALLTGAVIVGGSEVAARSGIEFAALRMRLAAKERDFRRDQVASRSRYSLPEPGSSPELGDDPDEAETDEEARTIARRRQFVRIAKKLLDEELAKHAPRAATARKAWHTETAGLRKSLEEEILTVYHEPSLRHGSLNWLISYRVKEIARRWHDRTLREHETLLRPGTRTVLGLSAGLIATVAAALYALIISVVVWPQGGTIALVVVIIGGLLVQASRIDRHLVQERAIRDGEPELTARFEAERAEYERQEQDLRDSPTDADIARWLDYDKIYLKTHALNQLGLARRDVLSSATLVEPGPGPIVGIRNPYGPPRYSKYRISTFLLTDSGVRQVSATLDTCTGAIYNQVRRSFRHDVIASATVLETGIRFETGRREAMPPEGHRANQGPHPSQAVLTDRARGFDASLILRQEISLHLMSSERIQLQVQSFDADYNDPAMEDPTYLLNIALDTSGISPVMELLEAISGHGAQWAAQRERQRRRRRTLADVSGTAPLRPASGPETRSDQGEVA